MFSKSNTNNKKKIINDPIYGFITVPHEVIFDIIEHPTFQRLRRIKQLGMSHLVYPGAQHTRFQHAIGATYLVSKAIRVIKNKGTEITPEEELACLIAILLHDIGHGPFSHTLEHDIVSGISHEEISTFFMKELAQDIDPIIELAKDIFEDNYPKKFLHQLVSSQLDMDRMDYLNRDSFYTGVSEGIIGAERIIEMLDVEDGQIVVEEKGIYSIEKFLVARRLMYWQVYLHKTVVASEEMLSAILKRAKELVQNGQKIYASPALLFFLENKFSIQDFKSNSEVLNQFARLDDFDVMGAIKVWQNENDVVLSKLCSGLVNRRLLKIEISKSPFDENRISEEKTKVQKMLGLSAYESNFFVKHDSLLNNAYNDKKEGIKLLLKSREVIDISNAADNLNISALAKPVEKYFLCFPVF